MTAPTNSPRPLIVKVDARHPRTDTYHVGLVASGFQVVRAETVTSGIQLARRAEPSLILVLDNLQAGLDAREWLAAQHADQDASLAMVPLLILASQRREALLRIHELPGRVRVLALPLDMAQLVQAVRSLISQADF